MINGIDVSKWQGNISWPDVAADGIKFAMIRLGYGSQNGGTMDPKFQQNVEGARNAGIDVGVYFYGTAVTEEAARAEAQFVLSALTPYRGKIAYPVAYDTEDSSQGALSKSALTAVVSSFCNTIREGNWYPMFYTSRSWLGNKLYPAKIDADVWLAQWAEQATYEGAYGIWQHSDSGSVKGISGNVDLDIAYVDYAEKIRTEDFNGYAESDPYAGVPEWARESVQWAVENGILRGSPEGLMLNAACTRMEMCVFLKRLYDLTQS